MAISTIQYSFIGGEISPSLYGRVDLAKWHSGASTMRNFFANYRGGAASRAGLAYVGMCKQQPPAAPPRDIRFQFNIDQGYALEFGDNYMRIKSQGAYVTEAALNIGGATQASQITLNIPAHGYAVGDWIYITGIKGMVNLNGLTWIVTSVPDANHVTISDLFGNAVNSSGWAAYTGEGASARLYTLVTPYAAVDLAYLKFAQSADTMSLCCVNPVTRTEYIPYDLERLGATDWTLTPVAFSSSILPPTTVTVTAQNSTTLSTWYSYIVTAIDMDTGEESVASVAVQAQNNDIAVYAGSNTITWTPVAGASSYNIYRATPSYGAGVPVGSLYGYIGTAFGTSFTDTNITADFTQIAPSHNDPFARGRILDVIPTAGGANYTQNLVSYHINTTTGQNFSGSPIVLNGAVAGFYISDYGQNYAAGNSITISGGNQAASGSLTFLSNPSNGQYIVLNGVTWTFVTTITSGPQILIGDDVTVTLAELAYQLNNYNSTSINVATYSVSGKILVITYKTSGPGGNAYTLNAGNAPATASGATLTGGSTGGGATASITVGPESGTYPSVVGYYQSRRVYANSLNQPDTYWMSKPNAYLNMDSSIPTVDDDAIEGTPWAQQINGIQDMVSMPGGLVMLAGNGAWQLNGGSQAAITPADQTATPQAYNGCSSTLPPIVINYDILYVQAKGSIVRDLSYNFFTNIYTGTDITLFSNHLFTNYQLIQWAYAEEPYKLVWSVRDDGALLSLTWLKEQDIYGWARHDTNGLFVGVCSVTEPPVDAIYVIVKRFVQGAWRYYSERMDNRNWPDAESSFCVDAGLSLPMPAPNATLSASSPDANGNVTFTASANVFTSANVGDVIRMGGGKITVTQVLSGNQVIGAPITPILATLPNDPNAMPIPAISGEWTITTPILVVDGLNHLEGMSVTILADGGVVPNQTVTNGSITLPVAASSVVVGLPFTAQLQTLNLDPPNQPVTAQGRRKSLSAATIRVEATRGLKVGVNQTDAATQPGAPVAAWSNLREFRERSPLTPAGVAAPLFTGDERILLPGGWDVHGQIAMQHDYPLPSNILAVIAEYQIGDTPG
jgi:hypothetical protein